MISHAAIRAAVLTTLKADTDVVAAINRAGWYTLIAPKALKTPGVVVGTITQPLIGVAGDSRRQTRFSDPITVGILVLCEKHDSVEADTLLGDVTEKVYGCLSGNKTLGLIGLHANVSSINSGMYEALGEHVVGSEIMLKCTFDE